MSTDRKELNDAIDSVSRAIDGCPNYWDRDNTMKVLRTLRAATRAHLETLPKTRTEWRVSYSEGGETRTWRTKVTEQEAVESGAYALACGKSCVSINSYQVPA